MNAALDYVVYDCEIRKCIPDRGAARDPELEYCGGWTDYAGMQISVICAWDEREKAPRVFCADNLDEFAQLVDGRLVIGYNNKGFDDKLVAAHGIRITRSWDLLVAVREAAGEPPHYVPGVTRSGRKLAELAQANLGVTKSLTAGALAPARWQRGKIGGVIDYCLRDVCLLRRLLRRLPSLVDSATGRLLTVELPAVPIAPPVPNALELALGDEGAPRFKNALAEG